MKTEVSNSYKVGGTLYMCCHKCGREVSGIGEEAVKVTCAYCVLKAVGMPEEKKSYISTGRPPGWHFMAEFVDKDGNVFHKGKEQPELKGTLKPTKVKPIKRKKKLTADEKLFKRAEKYKKKLKAKRRQKKK